MDIASITAIITAIVAITGAIATVINYTVIKPTQASNSRLQESIADLRALIDEIRRDLRSNEDKRQEMDLRLVAVEESAKSAHHRIDGIERG